MQRETVTHTHSSRLWPGLALALFSLLYFSLIYFPGLVRMDDFGYLRGVIATLAQGRPQTDAWLEPYSATLSTLSAAAYLLTGDFPLSTWGLQSLFVLGNFVLLYRLLRFRCQAGEAALLSLALATIPCYWHKCSEFAGNVSTVTFVLLALWAYLRGRWAWFFTAAFLAFANRQNGIALLALPAFHFLRGRFYRNDIQPIQPRDDTQPDGPGRAGRWTLAAYSLAFAAASLFLHSHMNRTVAQEYGIYAGMDPGKVAAILRNQLFGVFSGLSFLSCLGLLMGEQAIGNLMANIRKPWAPLALTVVFWMLPWFWPLPLVSFLTPLIGSLDRAFLLQKFLIVFMPICFWLLDYRHLRWDGPFCLFAGYTFLSGLRGYWYDFYLMDVALAALFFRITRESPCRMGPWARIAAALLIAGNIAWAYGYKIFSDKQMLSVAVYEKLERSGKVPVEDMTDATFGFLGWKLFEYYWRHERMTYPANFLCYARRDRVVIDSELPWRRKFKTDEAHGTILEEGRASIGFFRLRYRVLDKQGKENVPFCLSEPLTLDRSRYKPVPYPLDKREWSDLISTWRLESRYKGDGR